MPAPVTVPSRFNGPPSSGNGGWVAGALAAHVGRGPVRVTLRTPPPLETPMTVEVDGGTATMTHGDVLVAVAEPGAEVTAPAPVDAATAAAAEASYAGLRSHPFPGCFVCGTGRAEGDGLRIFPGRVDDTADGRARVAATWTPATAADTDLPTTWAALDCAGGWAGDLEERLMVLGRIVAHVHDLPRAGERLVVVGEARGTDGRRTHTATALYTESGRLLGAAEHTWFAVDPKDFA
ncbi:hypothetical protein [Nocardioides litoris]|uniref:hypothetical protein n=1 Tax=Nocardioides litoris TaxID=1926648 RepID=UPI001122D4F8|nr:hypothetical protein [Nocardioides litoris]